MASVLLCCKHLFSKDFLLNHPTASIGVLEKDYLNFWRHQFVCISKKYLLSICKLPSKASRVKPFLSTLEDLPGSFPKSCLELLFSREPDSTCFLIRNSTVDVISKFSRILKHAGLEIVIWSILHKETSLQSFSWTFFKKPENMEARISLNF